MNSANGEKIQDDGQKLLNGEYLPIHCLDRKQTSKASEERHTKMPSLRQYLFTLLAFSLLGFAYCSATATANVKVPRSPTHRDQQKFQELLNDIEPSALHEVIRDHVDKDKHGIYPEDKPAIAAVNQQTPEVASGLVELAKRQAGPSNNGTSVSTSSTVVTTETTSYVTSSITSSATVTQSGSTSSKSTSSSGTTSETGQSSSSQSSSPSPSPSPSPSDTGNTPTPTNGGTYQSGSAVSSSTPAHIAPCGFWNCSSMYLSLNSSSAVSTSSVVSSSAVALYAMVPTSNSTSASPVSPYASPPAEVSPSSSTSSTFANSTLSSFSASPYAPAPTLGQPFLNSTAGNTTLSNSKLSIINFTPGSSTPTNMDTDSGSKSSTTSSLSSMTSVTSIDIYTTTLPDGKPTTITQTTVVQAGGLPDQTGPGGASKTGGNPSLQTNVASAKDTGTNIIMGMIGMLFLGAL